jgi:hypothetical protein
MARRALHEWLEVMPSDQILWGTDGNHVERIYGATVARRTVLAEKVDGGDLTEVHAARIGRQVLRENALSLFPQLKGRLWKSGQPPAKAGESEKSLDLGNTRATVTGFDRDRREPCGSSPPTPPGIRVRTTAVRSG